MPDIADSPTLTISKPAETLALAGFSIPAHYGDPAAEYGAVKAGAGVFDRSAWGRLRIDGERPGAWLNGIVSNDTAALTPGDGCRALLLTVKGRIACDLWVYRLDDGLWIETAFDTGEGLAANLRKLILFGDRVTVSDQRPSTCQFTVMGPDAAATVQRATSHEVGAMKPCQALLAEPLVITAVRLGAVPAFDLCAPLAEAESLWYRLTEAARPFGWRAAEMLRIEAGLPRWGAELTGDALPLEAELESALSHTKGCYPGQEIVARMRDRGHANRLLRSLAIEGDAVPRRDATLSVPGDPKPVGLITSATAVPDQGVRGLGYIRVAQAEPGTRLEVIVPGGATAEAEVRQASGGWQP